MGHLKIRIRIGRRAASAFLLLFLLCLGTGSAWAQVEVRAAVSPNPASIEDEINLTVTITGSIQATEPVLPSMPAFKAISSGTNSSIEIINGSMSSRKEYQFVLIPLEEGKFLIEPISVFAKGVEYKTAPIEIIVTRSGQIPKPPAPGIPGPGAPAIPQEEEPFEQPAPPGSSQDLYWIETQVSNKEPFVNEQILFTFRFYTRVQVGAATLTIPEFKDFWSEEIVPEKKYYQNIGDARYVVSEKVIALYPLQSGEAQIGQTLLRAEVPVSGFSQNPFDDFFSGFTRLRTKPKNLKAPAIPIKVKPLPEGAPANFTNLVGTFKVSAGLSDSEIKAGESTTLNVEISGQGNIKDASLPDFFNDPAFKVYDDKPSSEIVRKESGIEGKKSFKKALVPTRPGEFSVPPVELSYFNPKTAQYEPMTAPGLTLTVLPSEGENIHASGGASQAEPAKRISSLKEDLAPIHQTLKPITSFVRGNELVLAALALIPFVLYLILFAIRRRRRTLQSQEPAIRSRNALKSFNRTLKALAKKGPQEGLPLLLDAIRDYVGDRRSVYGKSLTRPEIIRHLEEKGLKKELSQRLERLIQQMEAACYGGGAQRPLNEWIREASALMNEVDSSIQP